MALALGCLLYLIAALRPTSAWSLPILQSSNPIQVAPVAAAASAARQLNEVSPYLDLALCPIRAEPWSCARQQSARILDVWDGELNVQWQKLKVEADRQLNATIERRGYSASELPVKEKPSSILKKIEIGTNYMKEYLAETMDGFLGREYEYLQTSKAAAAEDDSENDQSVNNNVDYEDETDGAEPEEDGSDTGEEDNDNDNDNDDDDDEDDAAEEEEEEEDDDNDNDNDNDEGEADEDNSNGNSSTGGNHHAAEDEENESETSLNVAQSHDDGKNTVFSEDNGSSIGVEFIELEDEAGKKPGGGGKRKKKNKNKKQKRKKKGQQQQQQPATLVVVQAAPEHHEVDSGHESEPTFVSHGGSSGHGGGGKPFKRRQKGGKGKRKRKGQQSSVVVEEESSDLLGGLGLLDELADVDDVLLAGGVGGKRKHKNPTKYGRSNGVTRGKKKKKKKALMKLVLLGSFLKAKIELLLKILGAHLQIKFFAIALIGLLINIARFWIDVKRGGSPSKVVYVEHAHHQHHYEDHGDDWSEPGGSYWKRSLQTDPSVEEIDSSTDSYQVRPQQQQAQDAHYLAYRNQYQWQ
ncbi:uncharacterized protein [Drosophila tropicalis]|uniref:uncharacterized protein n=1 Tax=Drosophila tropicalis TaxID=46794 RepID=UPI0035ABC9C2